MAFRKCGALGKPRSSAHTCTALSGTTLLGVVRLAPTILLAAATLSALSTTADSADQCVVETGGLAGGVAGNVVCGGGNGLPSRCGPDAEVGCCQYDPDSSDLANPCGCRPRPDPYGDPVETYCSQTALIGGCNDQYEEDEERTELIYENCLQSCPSKQTTSTCYEKCAAEHKQREFEDHVDYTDCRNANVRSCNSATCCSDGWFCDLDLVSNDRCFCRPDY